MEEKKLYKSLIVHYEGRKFDIGEFIGRHPGGSEVLKAADGRQLDNVLNGNESVLTKTHKHSENALRMLEKYAIDKRLDDSDTVSFFESLKTWLTFLY